MREEIVHAELLEAEFDRVRGVRFRYRIRTEDASSVFDGVAEIINNESTGGKDEVCLDPGRQFWKFTEPRGKTCDWSMLKSAILSEWVDRSKRCD